MKTRIHYIKGYDRKYKISTKGTVWSKWTGRWKKLKPIVDRGYLYVELYKNGKHKRCTIHRLVLTTFVGPCPKGMVCRHFPDRNPTNNNLENLQWGTPEQNEADKGFHGTKHDQKGEKGPGCKITSKKVARIRKLYATGRWSQSKLGRRFGLSQNAISRIIRRVNWSSI